MPANSFESCLEKKGLKYTRERRCIYEKVNSLSSHFDVDRLYEVLKKEDENIARGTVYRTIPLLLESGVIQKSVGSGKGWFFERPNSKGHHDHIICVGCGKVIEHHNKKIEEHQMKICKKYKVSLHAFSGARNEFEMRSPKNLSSLLEPILMLGMGLFVGFIAVSIITPIYEVTQHLHK